MGTPEPAAKCLQEIMDAGHTISAVITQPDRPKGRGLEVSRPPVKELALKNNIPVHQPEKIKESKAIELITGIDADIIVVVAYGSILPKEIIFAKKYGSINVHASLLPKYRGAAPIQRAIINGEKETGITIQNVAVALDSGDILLQEHVAIDDADNARILTEKLFDVGAPLLIKAISLVETSTAKPVKQDGSKATLAPTLSKETGAIDWKKTTKQIFDQIRGCNPWPIAYTYYNKKIFRIFTAEPGLSTNKYEPGVVTDLVNHEGFEVGTSDGSIFIKEVQLENGKRMHAWNFINGHDLKPGDIFPN
jgi:methionyl-tRNA formyltransferase